MLKNINCTIFNKSVIEARKRSLSLRSLRFYCRAREREHLEYQEELFMLAVQNAIKSTCANS